MQTTWVVNLTDVTSTGNLVQLYPPNFAVGVNPATSVAGDQIRQPTEGFLRAAQVQTDGSNGGYIEVWDVNGLDAGVDVSSATTITNAQLTTLINLGRANLIWSQNFTATSGASTPAAFGKQFVHGLAARFVGLAGSINLNLDVEGGARLVTTAGHS